MTSCEGPGFRRTWIQIEMMTRCSVPSLPISDDVADGLLDDSEGDDVAETAKRDVESVENATHGAGSCDNEPSCCGDVEARKRKKIGDGGWNCDENGGGMMDDDRRNGSKIR